MAQDNPKHEDPVLNFSLRKSKQSRTSKPKVSKTAIKNKLSEQQLQKSIKIYNCSVSFIDRD